MSLMEKKIQRSGMVSNNYLCSKASTTLRICRNFPAQPEPRPRDSGTLDRKAGREHPAFGLSPNRHPHPTPSPPQIPTPVSVCHQPVSPGSPESLVTEGRTWSPVAQDSGTAAGPALRPPHPVPTASSTDAGGVGRAAMSPACQDHKATNPAASRASRPLREPELGQDTTRYALPRPQRPRATATP